MNIIETNLKFGALYTRKSTKRAILHHAEASKCTAEDIHHWHKQNGWSGAGYHFLVRKDGSIYRLRPEWAVGAHAKGSNSDSIGICFEGSYMTETMPQAQINAGRELLSWLKGKYGFSKVQAHRDVCQTNCPGTNFPFTEIAGVAASNTPVNSTPAPTPTPAPSGPSYRTGTVYTLLADHLRVRTGPGTGYATKSRKQLTVNAREHAYSNGTLKKGTRVTCKDVRKVGSDIWIKIPSGWIAAYYDGKKYVG